MKPPSLLRTIRVDPARGGERAAQLPFLSQGPVEIRMRAPLTLLVGENGSGKTTLLEAVAARCAIRPGGGRSYAATEGDRDATAISAAVEVAFAGRRPKGLFLRADRFAETMARAGRLPMATTGEWRMADEQSRGEGVLSLLTARVDASEGMLFLLDEPETGLSPQRQMSLLCLLDELHRDGRSQAVVATHSPILMAHPGADLLWLDQFGVTPAHPGRKYRTGATCGASWPTPRACCTACWIDGAGGSPANVIAGLAPA